MIGSAPADSADGGSAGDDLQGKSYEELIGMLPPDYAYSGATTAEVVENRAVYKAPSAAAMLRMTPRQRAIYRRALQAKAAGPHN